MTTMSENVKALNLDRILVEEVGQWGKFQFRAVAVCGLVSLMSGLTCYLYLFTLTKMKTRCVIPECETGSGVFSPPWILDAVPVSGDSFDNCHRYQMTGASANASEYCPASLFNRNSTIACEKYVYEHKNSAYFEFDLACDDWRPTLIGSTNFLGYMISLLITGIVADSWGRRLATTLSTFNLAWIGSLTYFAGSYNSYLVICFIQCIFGVCSFACAYVSALEYVGPKYRVIAGVSVSTCVAIGMSLLGLIAWTEPYWRNLILIICLPQFISVMFFWIMPESIRWLMSKGRYEESLVILKKAAEINGGALSDNTLKAFSSVKDGVTKEKDSERASEPWLVCLVFKHKPILLRCIVTPIWWLSSILIYYGLTISSVGISGNRYLNYTVSVAIEIPGYWIALLLLDRIGRKALLVMKFLISGTCQFAFMFLSDEHYWLALSAYLIGKMCIAGVMTSLYVYTAELYPTRYRTSLLAYSSMIGRVGGIIAPLMPGLAAEVWVQLPFLVFGVLALVSASLVLLAPETLGAALPDSMEEAARLGTSPSFFKCLRRIVFRSKSYTL